MVRLHEYNYCNYLSVTVFTQLKLSNQLWLDFIYYGGSVSVFVKFGLIIILCNFADPKFE